MRPVGGRETRALLLQPVHTEAQEEYDPREQQRAACAQQLRPAGLDEAGVAHGMIVDALAAKRMGEVVVRPLESFADHISRDGSFRRKTDEWRHSTFRTTARLGSNDPSRR